MVILVGEIFVSCWEWLTLGICKFINNKFTGTGNVRVTTKKGVYEGEVNNYQCVDNNPIKKISAPKTPKYPKPNIVVEYIVKW